MNKNLMTVKDVSKLLGYSPGTIYNLVSRNEIPFIKLSPKALRFDQDEIDKWKNERILANTKEAKVA